MIGSSGSGGADRTRLGQNGFWWCCSRSGPRQLSYLPAMLVHEDSGYRAASAADPYHESTRVIRPLAWEPSHRLVCVTVTEWPCVMGIVIFTVDAAQVTVCASSWSIPVSRTIIIAGQSICLIRAATVAVNMQAMGYGAERRRVGQLFVSHQPGDPARLKSLEPVAAPTGRNTIHWFRRVGPPSPAARPCK